MGGSLYVLKQAGRVWNEEIDSTLLALGYIPCKFDTCISVHKFDSVKHYIALYVDDLLMVGPSIDETERGLKRLESKYGIKRLGSAEYFLGIQVIRGQYRLISLSQEAYLKDVLAGFNMTDGKAATTPMIAGLQLDYGLSDTEASTKTRYLQAIGSLMYSALGTPPDLSHMPSIFHDSEPSLQLLIELRSNIYSDTSKVH